MKPIKALMLLNVFTIAFFLIILSLSAAAQDQNQKGWLEGTTLTADGEPITCKVRVIRNGKQVASDLSNTSMGGLFEIRDLKPGVYEIRANYPMSGYRPQRIFGVTVKPGVRSTLNIVLNEGSKIEEIGEPVVATEPVIVISQELTRIQKEIDTLKNK
jgi:hypothetical protein